MGRKLAGHGRWPSRDFHCRWTLDGWPAGLAKTPQEPFPPLSTLWQVCIHYYHILPMKFIAPAVLYTFCHRALTNESFLREYPCHNQKRHPTTHKSSSFFSCGRSIYLFHSNLLPARDLIKAIVCGQGNILTSTLLPACRVQDSDQRLISNRISNR